MGYEIYVTRADQWPEDKVRSDCTDRPITVEEWEALVASDPELEIDYAGRLTSDEMDRLVDETHGLAGCREERGIIRFSEEQYQRLKELAKELKRDRPFLGGDGWYDTADWKAHPNGEHRCFWFERGVVSTKSPDFATLDKMLQIASVLSACVRGEHGEFYRRSGQGLECYEPGRGWRPLR